jgi:septum formation protein
MAAPDPQIVLASASPRRSELLAQMKIVCRIVPAAVDETRMPGEPALDYVQRVAVAKAQAVAKALANPPNVAGAAAAARSREPLPVLGADTVVTLDGNDVLGKPENELAAAAMLRRLSGREHRVLTAVAMALGPRVEVRVGTAVVRFRTLEAHEIAEYARSGEGMDKAGGYGIQGIGGIFAEHIEGSYSAIVGLPLVETELLLRAFGVDTWRNRGT